MGYYVRVLGIENKKINYKSILEACGNKGHIEIEQGEPENWELIVVKNENGAIMTVQKDVVTKGSLGEEELKEFTEEIEDCYPKSAVKWLKKYFKKVKVIYALGILKEAYEDDNWDVVNAVKETIWNHVGGIIQADMEGFTNDDGYHILWQFNDDVDGTWYMAILNGKNEWETFEMDLGDKRHRELFMEGKRVEK